MRPRMSVVLHELCKVLFWRLKKKPAVAGSFFCAPRLGAFDEKNRIIGLLQRQNPGRQLLGFSVADPCAWRHRSLTKRASTTFNDYSGQFVRSLFIANVFFGNVFETLSLIHISEPTRLGMISYA